MHLCATCGYPIPGGSRVCTCCLPTLAVQSDVAALGMLLREPLASLAECQPALFGKFNLRRTLGHGAMGVVYEAIDVFIGRRVAVKVARLGQAATAQNLEVLNGFFAQEARAAGGLRHPNIVVLHEAGQFEGFNYLVMEYVEGVTLGRLLQETGALTLQRAIGIARQIAGALAYAHERQVIHRDIKPANVLIESGDAVKVVDFGLAKLLTEAAVPGAALAGTPAYMAPEQLLHGQVDLRTDLFALAAVFYECVTGYSPFGGTSLADVIHQVVNEPPRPLPLVDSYERRAYSAFFEVALGKDPEKRFQTAAAFLRALDRLEVASGRASAKAVPAAVRPAAASVERPQLLRPPRIRPRRPARCRAAVPFLATESERETAAVHAAALQGCIRDLEGPNAEQRLVAARQLAELGAAAEPAATVLVAALRDVDTKVRWAAAETLVCIGGACALTVAEALRDVAPHVRLIAAAVLGQIGPAARRAVPALIDAMRDRSPEVRRQAAESLGAIGSEARAAVKTLLHAAGDWVEEVREEARRALGRIGPSVVPALVARLDDPDERRYELLAALLLEHEEAALPALVGSLGDPSARVRRRAAEILTSIGPRAPEAVEALSRALEDRDPEVRAAAAKALDYVLKIF